MPHVTPKLAFVLVLAGVPTCRAGGADDPPPPVAECIAYEQAFARCTGRHEPIATQPAAIPTSEEQRASLKKLCLANLDRLRKGCFP